MSTFQNEKNTVNESPNKNEYLVKGKKNAGQIQICSTSTIKKEVVYNDEEISLLLPTKIDVIISKKKEFNPLMQLEKKHFNLSLATDFSSSEMTNKQKRIVIYHKI